MSNTRFDRKEFHYHGGYLTYGTPWTNESKFIARFKYGATRNKPSFLSFLIKHFSQEEYFARHEAGESPLEILKSKGYVSPNLKKYYAAKAAGAVA